MSYQALDSSSDLRLSSIWTGTSEVMSMMARSTEKNVEINLHLDENDVRDKAKDTKDNLNDLDGFERQNW